MKQDDIKRLEAGGKTSLIMPKKPGFGDKKESKEKEESNNGKIAFDLDKVYDLDTFSGRFQKRVHSSNPIRFFTPPDRIK